MAKKRTKKRKTKRRSTSRRSDTPGWLWGAFGLAIGLSVAVAVYVKDRRPDATPRPVATTPTVTEPGPGTIDDNGETLAAAREPVPNAGASADVEDDSGERRFTFYEMLLKSEVVVDDEETGSSEPVAVVEPGTYALQVGSFSTETDADRRRAELALQGIESNIQKASVSNRIYYRVRIGPTDDLDELNLLRSRLRAAKIDAMIVREVD